MSRTIYKICPELLWREAERSGVFLGAPIDRQDGYMHFSTAEQVAETAAKHFSGAPDLVLVAVDAELLGPRLKWEPSRGGALFPHLFGSMSLGSVLWVKRLPLGPSGRHVFPDLSDGASGATILEESGAMLRTFEGGCHCGRVRFRVSGDLSGVTECNCSICAKKGFLHLIVPPEQFELLLGAEDFAVYRFNTGTAKHTFCRHCGIHAFYVPRSDPDKIDVNVRCLDGIDLAAIRPHPFDGQNWEHAMTEKPPWR